ncbi:MAG: Histidine kinase [Candidatus Magasanikbacteria bacterium GW2011_GWA2_41_55]|uniref:histidine kinase n=1 Tax=Candidatus Magasanikbacteria bacterium GW2011_GWA2_41_55 TaxID=1619038 RepID=A0A0G0WIS3_9BACT|nr:MAG: Histidine kinase [Candidatus Magasanikbacteria bacterium GW2011_GWA2_41_55]
MNSSFWFFPASALINAVTSTVLGFYLIFTGISNRVARYLLFFCVSVAAWSYCYFFWQISTDADSALFWARALMFGAIFSSISYLHLVLVFLKLDNLKFYKITIVIFYVFSLFWVIANLTPYFVAGITARSYFKFWPLPGPFYTPYLVAFFAHVVYASILLFKNYRQSRGSQKISSFLLLAGIVVAFIGGSTNYPLWYGIDIAPWGNVLVGVYVVLTVYAMLKYKLMDIKVVSAELFTGLLAIILLTDLFLSKNSTEIIFRALVVVAFGVFGIMLIRSVRHEVKRREEIQRLAEQLNDANARLQALDKLKSEFLSISAHQLRTPLTVIKGYVSMIQEGDYGKLNNPKIETVLDNVYKSNEHLIYLVNDFLDVSRIEGGRTSYTFVKTDLKKVAEELVMEITLPIKEKDLQFKVEIAKNLPQVTVDMEKIRNVMLNFLTNAVKYTPKGWLKMELFKKGRQIVYQVSDNGIGLTKFDLENVFQKFYRAEEAKKITATGVGLGLFVVKKFIEAHDGEVFVESPGPGQGATFGFKLPIKRVG